MLEFEDFIELSVKVFKVTPVYGTCIRTPSQSNMPTKGNAHKTSFQHLEIK